MFNNLIIILWTYNSAWSCTHKIDSNNLNLNQIFGTQPYPGSRHGHLGFMSVSRTKLQWLIFFSRLNFNIYVMASYWKPNKSPKNTLGLCNWEDKTCIGFDKHMNLVVIYTFHSFLNLPLECNLEISYEHCHGFFTLWNMWP